MGADTLVNPQHDSLDDWKAEKGYFDISFEVLGILPISTCLEVTRASVMRCRLAWRRSPQLPDDGNKQRDPERLFPLYY